MKKNYTLSTVKVISAFMVVLIHVTSYIYQFKLDTFWNFHSYRKILDLGVPIFFASTGFILYVKKDYPKYVEKYLNQILQLFLIASGFYFIFNGFVNIYTGDFSRYLIGQTYTKFLNGTWGDYHLWYLWSLYLSLILYKSVTKYLSNDFILIAVLLTYFLELSLGIQFLPFLLNGGIIRTLLFILIGMYAASIKMDKTLNAILLCISLIIYYVFNVNFRINLGEVFLIIFIFLLYTYIANNTGNRNLFNQFDRFTTSIYIFHVFYLTTLNLILPLQSPKYHSFPITIIISFLTVTSLSMLTAIVLRKLDISKKLGL